MNTAIFGGGCFWCTEAVFKILKGVTSVSPGYAGGHTENPMYDQVSAGTTGHAEVIRVEYDPQEISYRNLLAAFFASHDPTTLNRQGNDVGTQYRSIILYASLEEKIQAEEIIEEINSSQAEGDPVVTEVKPLDHFYEAEEYHRNYYAKNRNKPYCQLVINPKLEKVQKELVQFLKE